MIPASLLRYEIEHAEHARRFAEQSAAVFDGVFLRCRGKLVDEALDHEDVVRGTDAAPPTGRETGGFVTNIIYQDVGNRIGQFFRGTLDGIGVETVSECWRGPSR